MVEKKHNPKYIEAQKRGKVDYSVIPWEVISMLAQAMMEGANKYGRFNFLEDDIEARTYIGAISRHMFGDPSTGSKGWANGEDIDEESGLPHTIKIMACCMLVEAAKMHGKLIDNRMETESKPPPSAQAPLVELTPDEAAEIEIDRLFRRTIGPAHKPTLDELADLGRAEDPIPAPVITIADDPDSVDAWDAVFTELAEDNTRAAEQRRGPYEDPEQARSYAQRNPERLDGIRSIQPSLCKVRENHA